MVSGSYIYGPVLQKLEKYAGKGNYTFMMENGEDDDDKNEDENSYNNEDEFYEDESENNSALDDIENNFIDFDNIRNASDKELKHACALKLSEWAENI